MPHVVCSTQRVDGQLISHRQQCGRVPYLSEAAEHLCDRLSHHRRLLPLHQGNAVVRPRKELVLLR